MSDIIKLLPDNVANQIAAGEVVQRPSSAVKELLENAIDAGGTKIDLIIKDAGKTLIQVVDNGCGMTETDARMCFERHATSKITNSNDLFSIRTKGFRGEALASIAAIAQVEMQSKVEGVDLGTSIIIEGSEVKSQEPIACSVGTNFIIKNLFFNVPARRNFLKSTPVETKHIVDEFERVALTHPNIHFTMHHNGNEVFNLPSTTLRQRIVNVFGKKMNERIVPIEQETTVVNVSGYIIKPEFAKRTRGEQFFFVNDRFIKSSYLNHAIKAAYKNLISNDQFPSYFIYLEVAPDFIDINIHPTKTEIKFEDERTVYAILNSAIKNSLGKYNIAPSLDFEQETSFNVAPLKKGQEIKMPTIQVDTSYNPFENTPKKSSGGGSSSFKMPKSSSFEQEDIDANLDFLASVKQVSESVQPSEIFTESKSIEGDYKEENNVEVKQKFYQLHQKYILTQVRSGLLMIDQQRAHQRILFEQFLSKIEERNIETQKLLFPQQIELTASDFALISEMIEELNNVGFEISVFGQTTIVINGLPVGVSDSEAEKIIERLLEELKHSANQTTANYQQRMAMIMANSSSINAGRKLEEEEMEHLFNELFACQSPNFSPSGKPVIIKMEEEELDQRFERKK
jgi:DNA mismatch repair protein MutL